MVAVTLEAIPKRYVKVLESVSCSRGFFCGTICYHSWKHKKLFNEELKNNLKNRFWIQTSTKCQILNRKQYNVSYFKIKSSQRSRIWRTKNNTWKFDLSFLHLVRFWNDFFSGTSDSEEEILLNNLVSKKEFTSKSKFWFNYVRINAIFFIFDSFLKRMNLKPNFSLQSDLEKRTIWNKPSFKIYIF